MAGKTTFLKTIGINHILGHSLGVCLSEKAIVPNFYLKTFIDRNDDLSNNKSYYYVEVETIGKFLCTISNYKYLFLLDEIFRGTNSIERIAASAAVLKKLAENNLVFATTHDIELQELLQKKYQMYHLSEVILMNRYCFDYRLKKGASNSRNAIKLLEISGYSRDITSEATQLAKNLDKRFQIIQN